MVSFSSYFSTCPRTKLWSHNAFCIYGNYNFCKPVLPIISRPYCQTANLTHFPAVIKSNTIPLVPFLGHSLWPSCQGSVIGFTFFFPHQTVGLPRFKDIPVSGDILGKGLEVTRLAGRSPQRQAVDVITCANKSLQTLRKDVEAAVQILDLLGA